MLEKYIEQLRPYVIELFKNDSTGHDISHLERTMKIALQLQEREGGDRIVIGISAFLHDVHRIMQSEAGKFVSPKDSLETIRSILSHIDLKSDQVERICYCIEHHEEYNWNGHNVDDINTLILQDADNLDAVGAMGIARTFSYGGAHNRVMYDSSIPINESDDYDEANGDNESTSIHHFYHKLFKLGTNMNTTTARLIAEKRIDFMREFVNQFLVEWNGDLGYTFEQQKGAK